MPDDERVPGVRTRLPHRMIALRRILIVLACFVVVGALCGVLLDLLWTPPEGVAYQGEWVLDPQADASFSATGWYVVLALIAGALSGLSLAWWWSDHEVPTAVGILLGAVAAGYVMFRIGHWLGPIDPETAVRGQDDLTPVPGDLELAGWAVFTAFPIGSMITMLYAYLMTNGRTPARIGSGTAG